MRFMRYFGLIPAALLLASTHVAAQGIFDPLPVVSAGGTVIGPDGSFYALLPGANSTFQNPSTDLVAVGVGGAASSTPKWTATLTGRVGQVLPGSTTVFVVETTTSGSGRNTVSTTAIALYSAATGAKQSTSISPAGPIVDIQVRNIGGSDYLYVYTISSASSTAGGTTTFTTMRTLTVYTATGTVFETVPL